MILVLLTLCMSTIALEHANNPFQTSPGIYFEDMGPVQLYSTSWKLIIYYNLTNYNLELEGYRNCLSKINVICPQLQKVDPNNDNCRLLVNQFNLHLNEIEQLNTLLFSHLIRSKRSLIDGGGHLLNYVFGLLDQDDANHYNNEIEKSRLNEERLLNLIKNQTLIADSTTNVLKQTQQDIEHQFIIFDQHLNKISWDMNWEKLRNTLTDNLNTITSYSILLLMRFRNTQNALLDSVTMLAKGKLNARIISPDLFLSQVVIIKNNLPQHLNIPTVNNRIDINLLYAVSETRVRVTTDKVIFEIKIPLVSVEIFQLFHLIPVPTRIDENFYYIEPSTEYLLANYLREHFTSISQMDLDSCTLTSTAERICKQNQPITNQKSPKYTCEAQLLNHPTSVPNSCKKKKINPQRYWKRLANNRHLYSLERPYTADQICNTQITHYKLENNGIIEIPQGCYLRVEDTILYPEQFQSTYTQQSYIPSINLSTSETNNTLRLEISTTPNFKFNHSATKILSDMIHQQTAAESEINLNSDITKYGTHYMILMYILLATLILILFFYLYKKYPYSKLCHRKNSFDPNNPLESIYTTVTSTETRQPGPSHSKGNLPIPELKN